MAARRTFFLWVICGLLIIPSFAGYVWGDNLSPAQEQEFIDAKTALEEAKKAQADKYSPRLPEKGGRIFGYGRERQKREERRHPVRPGFQVGSGPCGAGRGRSSAQGRRGKIGRCQQRTQEDQSRNRTAEKRPVGRGKVFSAVPAVFNRGVRTLSFFDFGKYRQQARG